MRRLVVLLVSAALGAAFVMFCTVLVTPPGPASTAGQIQIVERRGPLQFLDSPDALCQRAGRPVTPECRTAVIGALPPGRSYVTLPYVDFLYRQTLSGRS
ncbi:hypothetical protein [Phreatobacter stygius]|uniref:Uncharacterized protein n=1 Tax=Phreatobacter stygius TaxID=1940610 RepID=A0A4D7AUN4_9HYPH|nr:hypothetical protein [Phreatobacter stygius]QCI64589.1 hypothetical protein E8M01_10320 [Phreatobacter stygius]